MLRANLPRPQTLQVPPCRTWWLLKLKKAWEARSAMKHSSAVGWSR